MAGADFDVAARARADQWPGQETLGFAPASSSILMIAVFPRDAAIMRGVLPFVVGSPPHGALTSRQVASSRRVAATSSRLIARPRSLVTPSNSPRGTRGLRSPFAGPSQQFVSHLAPVVQGGRVEVRTVWPDERPNLLVSRCLPVPGGPCRRLRATSPVLGIPALAARELDGGDNCVGVPVGDAPGRERRSSSLFDSVGSRCRSSAAAAC